MFEKTLTDVVKGIRASKRDTALFISQCIAEIKHELQSADMYVKANALQKLTFLQMMGYSMSVASFATIEVMSSPRFAHKRIGYLAASQGFTPDTEVILLTTNLLQKELRGAQSSGQSNMQGVYEAGLAINCLSNIVTADLARDVLPELTQLTTHPQPYLRKKAILCLFKLFCQYPQGLRLTFSKLQACLQDTSPAVVSCAVNVLTELADHSNPHNYLPLAPAFFDLLVKSQNNWMLIKVVKLLARLVPCEPRLARKLLEPLANIVKSTQAKSLLYEAVHTITTCLSYVAKADGSIPQNVPDIVALSAATLRSLVQEQDQNLKYLGLVGFASLLQSHPKVLSQTQGVRPLILACLSDPDVTIRTRALELLTGLATRKNLRELVEQLLPHLTSQTTSSTYRHALVAQMVALCRVDKYSLLQGDFEWYFDLLLQLSHLRGVESHATLLHKELENVALRVLPVRTYAVQQSVEILLRPKDDTTPSGGGGTAHPATTSALLGDNGRGKHVMPQVLPALSWILGEYADLLPQALPNANINLSGLNSSQPLLLGPYHAIVHVLTLPQNVQSLDTSTQTVHLQAALKVLAAASSLQDVKAKELEACVQTLQRNLPIYMQSDHVEVVERAFTALELLRALNLTDGSSNTAVPGLAAVDDEDDSDDDDSDAAANPPVAKDLLGLGGDEDGPNEPERVAPTQTAKSTTASGGLGAKIQAASATLNQLLKPSPMKPASAKAQRKKQKAPMGHSIEVEAPVDLSVLSPFLEEETAFLQSHKLTMESVSFTQQRPMTTTTASAATPTTPASIAADAVSSASSSMMMSSPMGQSFQNAAGTPSQQQQQQRQNDPFYLDSGAPEVGDGDGGVSLNRLNTIQLPDDEEDDDDAGGGGTMPSSSNKKLSKKERKKQRKQAKKDAASAATAVAAPTTTTTTTTDFLSFDPHASAPPPAPAAHSGEGDLLAGLGGGGGSTTTVPAAATQPPVAPTPTAAAAAVTILDSDDDDEEDQDSRTAHSTKKQNKTSKLAKVDLIAPLGEHEVMDVANRTHHAAGASAAVTPTTTTGYADSSFPQQQQPQQQAPKSKKELKKEKKEAKKKKKAAAEQQKAVAVAAPADAGVDLLDMGAAFGSSGDATPSIPAATTASSNSGDAISSAFDDLLGMTTPAPAPTLPPTPSSVGETDMMMMVQSSETPTKKPSRPWIKGSIKSTHATVPGLDWSRTRLLFRTYRSSSHGGGSAATNVVVRVEHFPVGDAVVSLDLNHGEHVVALGNASSAAESPKLGPFMYAQVDTNHEVKGVLQWSNGGGTVPIKLVLPATMHLSPDDGLQLEQVAQELASESFSATSAKITIPRSSSDNMETIAQAMCGVLHAAKVLEPTSNPQSATLACRSAAAGAKVRVLVKIKDGSNSVKVDIRCTNPSLGEALASDLKKVVF